MAKTVITVDDAEFTGLHSQGSDLAFLTESGEEFWYRKVTDNETETWYLITKRTEQSSFGSLLVVDGIVFQAPYNPDNVPEESD
jgi:hypothetical protein